MPDDCDFKAYVYQLCDFDLAFFEVGSDRFCSSFQVSGLESEVPGSEGEVPSSEGEVSSSEGDRSCFEPERICTSTPALELPGTRRQKLSNRRASILLVS